MKQLLGRRGLAWYISFVCVASELVMPGHLGMQLCMVQCLRYNRCFGVKMNATTMTCTLLNNRHTDGNIMDASRSRILQTMRTGRTCIASKHYKRLFCIINSKGQSVDIRDHTGPPEDTIIREDLTFKKASLQNCKSSRNTFEIMSDLVNRLHDNETFVGMVDRDIVPGTKHLISKMPSFQNPPSRAAQPMKWRLLTVAVTDTPTVNINRMSWNITYFYDFTSGKYQAEYSGFGRSEVRKNITKFNFAMLVDRSSAGDVLLDIDPGTGSLLGSALGPNLNQTMWIVVRLYLPANVKLYTYFGGPRNLENVLYGWYQQQVI